MKEVKIGAIYESWGKTTYMIPDDIETDGPNAKQNILDYLNANIDRIALPTNAEYIDGSFELDEEGIIEVDGEKLPDV